MTPRDYANLDFLMSATPEVLSAWYDCVDQDDVNYAYALLEVGSLEALDDETEMWETFPDAQSIIMRARHGQV